MVWRASLHAHDIGTLVPSLEAVGQDSEKETVEAYSEALRAYAERTSD